MGICGYSLLYRGRLGKAYTRRGTAYYIS